MRLTMIFAPLIAMTALNSTIGGGSVPFFIGTYTSAGSKGIYCAHLDLATGAISTPVLAAETGDPSFVAIHPNGKYLYSIDEGSNGNVSAFAIQPDLTLKLLNTKSADAPGPCHVSVDPKGRFVTTAGYSSGFLTSFPIAKDGSLEDKQFQVQNEGHGPNHARQEGPHMHGSWFTNDGRFLYACDLGTDQVLIYKIESHHITSTDAKAPAGAGPRHIAFGPNEQFVYVAAEMGNEVLVFARDTSSGQLKHVQTVSTLPEGENTEGKTVAEIVTEPKGHWLYVSNRGDDSIACFHILQNGHLESLGIVPARVHVPRSIAIDPTGKWLIAAGQDSNSLTVFAIEPRTGRLQAAGAPISTPHPVCICFLRG